MGKILEPPGIAEVVGVLPIVDDLPQSAARALRDLASAIEAVGPYKAFHVWEIACYDLSFASAFMARSIFKAALGEQQTSIYSIGLIDGPTAREVLEDLTVVKSAGTHKYPRLSPIEECDNSTTLYVGSSRSTSKRLAEHLGTCHPSTYGLRLGEWASHWPGKIRIEVRTYTDIASNHLQLLEDHLASILRPILGKRGGK